MGGRPMLILGEDSERTSGEDAQQSNINAAKAIAESVRTTLGPKGMDKMLVSSGGDVTITNDGATILEEMDIEHPAAQMLVEVAQAQEADVGDGTTTASVLAGKLLAEAEGLLEQDIHPTTIAEGYNDAEQIALDAIADAVLEGEIDDETLVSVAESSMTGKGTGGVTAGRLAKEIVDAVRQVEQDGAVTAADVSVLAKPGQSSTATELVRGFVGDVEPVREDMPTDVEDPTVAVVDVDLAQRESAFDAEYNITSADQFNQAVEAEESTLAEQAQALADAGVDVVFCAGDVADGVASRLAAEGILAFENVGDDDLSSILRSTGATRIGDVTNIEDDELGNAERVHLDTIEGEELVFVEGGAATQIVTLFVRGGTDHVLEELERAIQDGIDVVVAAVNDQEVVPGAGATEIIVSSALRDAASGISGRKQLAVEAFADAVDSLPRTLAENTGMDPIDALVDLRAANDGGRAGIIAEGENGRIADPVEHGILDPAEVKREAVESATEAATMIVRIDDVISAE